MKTKLTLRLDEELIAAAKQEAATRGTSISSMVANFFNALRQERKPRAVPHLSPITAALAGLLAGSRVTEDDYKRHLEKKHR